MFRPRQASVTILLRDSPMTTISYVKSGGTIDIAGTQLVCTCSAAPEQYDVFLGTRQIGYLRLKWGEFYAAYPDVSGDVVYAASIDDEASIFSDNERAKHLPAAVNALLSCHQRG